MKLSRDWATPLTIGSFGLMGLTGLLMFFHLDSGLNKSAHEWVGWVMVGAVLLHVSMNWPSFRRYFTRGVAPRAILGFSALVIAASFVRLGDAGGGPPPPLLAVRAVMNAPLSALAPLAGRPAEALLAELRAAGFSIERTDQSLATVVGADREREARALSTLFGRQADNAWSERLR